MCCASIWSMLRGMVELLVISSVNRVAGRSPWFSLLACTSSSITVCTRHQPFHFSSVGHSDRAILQAAASFPIVQTHTHVHTLTSLTLQEPVVQPPVFLPPCPGHCNALKLLARSTKCSLQITPVIFGYLLLFIDRANAD